MGSNPPAWVQVKIEIMRGRLLKFGEAEVSKSVNYNDEDRIATHQEPDSGENAENYHPCQFLRDCDDRYPVSRIMAWDQRMRRQLRMSMTFLFNLTVSLISSVDKDCTCSSFIK